MDIKLIHEDYNFMLKGSEIDKIFIYQNQKSIEENLPLGMWQWRGSLATIFIPPNTMKIIDEGDVFIKFTNGEWITYTGSGDILKLEYGK